jgi:citrate synthase
VPDQTLTVVDNRTAIEYTIPVSNGAIRASDLRQIKTSDDDDVGLISYDPSLAHTATCRSAITYVDGENGVLRYRGYPIEQLAAGSTFLETAYLITYGQLPTESALREWEHSITNHTMLHENIKKFTEGFRYDAHPMGMLQSTIAALSTFYPDAKDISDPESRELQTFRAIAKMPTIAAFAYRHSLGLPYIYPDNRLSYAGNFLNMLFHPLADVDYRPDPVVERAIDALFILHADHEQNCSANAMRSVGSSRGDPFSALASACSALYGPLHGGANEAVIRMLERIGSTDNVPAAVEAAKRGGERLMGFGHRVYTSYDPRAKIVKKIADDVFQAVGRNPLLDIALELERTALADEYFIERNLFPNIDFYSGIIYQAAGFPVEMFPVLFAIPRTVGWMAQWREMITDPEQRIARPRQVYIGEGARDYVPLADRA